MHTAQTFESLLPILGLAIAAAVLLSLLRGWMGVASKAAHFPFH